MTSIEAYCEAWKQTVKIYRKIEKVGNVGDALYDRVAELIVLYGDPNAIEPKGVIKADEQADY